MFGGKGVDIGEAVTIDEIFVGVIIAFWVCVSKAFKVIVEAEPNGPWSVIWVGVPEIPGRLQEESTRASEKDIVRSLIVFNFSLMITMKIIFGTT